MRRPNVLSFESFPLAGVLNVLYLANSIGECVDPKCRWSEQSTCISISRDCACDLDAGSTILLLLSSLTSAAMFALKICKLKVIKLSLDMEILRTHQHEELTAELQAMLSPSDFRRVSGVLNDHYPRRLSNGLNLGGPARVVPEGNPNQVRSQPLRMQMALCPTPFPIQVEVCFCRRMMLHSPTRPSCIQWCRSPSPLHPWFQTKLRYFRSVTRASEPLYGHNVVQQAP